MTDNDKRERWYKEGIIRNEVEMLKGRTVGLGRCRDAMWGG